MSTLTSSATSTTVGSPPPRAALRTAVEVRRYKRHTRYLELAVVVCAAGVAVAQLLTAT